MAKVKSINVDVYNKETKEVEKAFLDLDLNSASALGRAKVFGTVGVKDVAFEKVTIGENTINKVTDFKFATDKDDATSNLSIKKINFGFVTQEGKPYNIEKVLFSKAGEGLDANSRKLLEDVSIVARAGFLGNKGKTHTDADFYKGDINVFQGTYYVNPNAKGDFKSEPTDGYEKRKNIEKIDPRDVAEAQVVLDTLYPKREVEAPEAEDVGGMDR